MKTDTMDYEALKTMLNGIRDIGINLKASFKATLQKIKKYDGLHKEQRNNLKQKMTRYDIDKEKRIIVTNEIKDFLHKHLTTAITDTDIENLLTGEIDSFNMDIITKITKVNTTVNTVEKFDTFINDLRDTTTSIMDENAFDIITSGMTNATKEDISKLKSGEMFFAVSYLLDRKIKGILIENTRITYKTFKVIREPSVPTTLPLPLFHTIYDVFIKDDMVNVKDSIKLYKRLVEDSGKFYKIANHSDDERVINYIEQLENVLASYGNDIINHITDVRTYQRYFLEEVLEGFDKKVIGGKLQ